jgi:asparagine synthetase B (glutamine-hydrolysing)
MCGILVVVEYGCQNSGNDFELKNELVDRINDRGPSWSDTHQVVLENCKITFVSSVLSLRRPFTKQPVVIDQGVFQFNGELYNSDINGCDTKYFLELIQKFGVPGTLERLRGEYAFVYYERETGLIWYARDCIGRRSLVRGTDHTAEGIRNYFISSIAPDPRDASSCSIEEVDSKGLYVFQISTREWKTYALWTYGKDAERQEYIRYPYRRLPWQEHEINIGGLDDLEDSSRDLEHYLEAAVGKRVLNIPDFHINKSEGTEKTLAILFSGGIDCTLLAYFADKVLPENISIDLLNVSFENLRKNEGWDTPDRELGLRSWSELEEARRRRRSVHGHETERTSSRFRFVEINVPYGEMAEHRPFVQRLMWPKNGVMDLSIAIAFYFASRGQGTWIEQDGSRTENYTSSSRVLLSGLGADELFAGYSRHIGGLQKGGYENLARELQLDFDRLDQRNLGRDDRVSCTWGKEMRYPYLDEDLVDWAMASPLNGKLHEENGDGVKSVVHTKYILRLIAQRAGLTQVSKELKRAIQFGARSAKMEPESGKLKGHDTLAGFV